MRLDLDMLISTLRPLRHVYVKTLGMLGWDRRLVRRIHEGAFTAVLNLHRISPHESPYWPPLSPEMFSALVAFLKTHFEVVTLGELASTNVRKAAVVLSFDDGYRDFIEYAAPILASHGVRANMNVVPECVESGRPIWNVRLYDGLASSSKRMFRKLRVDGFSFPSEDDSPLGKARFGARLAAHLKNRPAAERLPMWRQVEHWLDQVEVKDPTAMMTVDEVRSIAETHEIGVHSFSHESMAFETDAFFREDVRRCRLFFAERLGLPLSIYAFPNGSYRPSQIEYLLGSGFDYALVVDEKLSANRAKVLPRISINAPSLLELKLQAVGHWARGVS